MKSMIAAAVAMFAASTALADVWVTGTITELRVIASGTPSNDGIAVFGNFTPSMGCANNAFMFFSTDPYFKESYAALLAAKVSGQPIKFAFSFCTSAGYGRGNAYSLAP